ncbi:hypothetical protein GRF59_19640 [Paenibacillus sp. HJL G12]|uniref:Uncharacterized protein n=1 Tax=Paenibacillus dendrobii TaxID=2691084 RepID=A0A7X3LI75_9BACL|nr:hypothetical protein [Paenibacillus dendrobii]MWV45832.1 hypothetical protein [Paenibacillus dendrobii]
MRGLRATEFTVWVFTRTELVKFVVVEILFSSALYAGLKRVNGHEAIAILGSSVGTHLFKYVGPGGKFPVWRSKKRLQHLPWSPAA